MADDIKDVSTRGALVAIAIATIVVAIVMTLAIFGGAGAGHQPKGKLNQAVFLTNGQVYFGKLSSVGSDYVTLKDVYYIQSNPQQSPAPSPGPSLSLVQLGNEIHGPEKEMNISRQQIIFWENLRDDSKVTQAIKDQSKK